MKIKLNIVHKLMLAAFASMALFACEKEAVQIIDVPASGAQVKFFNFGVDAPIVNYFANADKISAAVSTTGVESGTTGIAYGSVFPATNGYAVLKPGTYTLAGRKPSTASTDPNLEVATLSANLEQGKYYSLYMSGIYNAGTKKSDSFIIEDQLPAVDTSGSYARFVHAISNATPFDFVVKNTTTGVETIIAKNISYKSGSTFVKVPSGTYELYARTPNTTTNIISRNGTSVVSMLKSNTYTFTIRGDITVVSTTLTNRPFIDNTPNR